MPKRTLGTWTARQRSDAIRLYRDGMGAAKVAAAVGVPRRTVQRWAKAAGVMRTRSEAEQLKRHGRIVFTPEAEAAIIAARERRVPVRSICRDLGITVASVYSVVSRRRRQPTTNRSLAMARRHNNPNTDKGRRRLDRIERLVAMERDGVSYYRMQRVLGMTQCGINGLRSSPYADALRRVIYAGGSKPVKRPHVVAMYWQQGLPADFIARALDVDAATVDRWIGGRRD